MKLSYIRWIIISLAITLFAGEAFAQVMVSTRITVQGSRYSDEMWFFSVGTCTHGFDNGWDGYKMIGTNSLSPQIFGMEETGNFQIDVVPDFNNSYIGFKAGEDTTYTMTFSHEHVETLYDELYLIDLLTNKVVNIFPNGTKYTFVSKPTPTPVKRFKIVTTCPASLTSADPLDRILSQTSEQREVFIRGCKKNIVIENSSKSLGLLNVYNANTGSLVLTTQYKAKGVTTISTDLPTGAYVVHAISETENIGGKIVLY